jgi:hypothetical protein
MRDLAPEGFDIRYPGGRRPKKARVSLWSFGPYHEISADGHEKLNSQALQMGDISLPIYLYRDKWSGVILKLGVIPDARTAAALGHVFLDFISEIGGETISSVYPGGFLIIFIQCRNSNSNDDR